MASTGTEPAPMAQFETAQSEAAQSETRAESPIAHSVITHSVITHSPITHSPITSSGRSRAEVLARNNVRVSGVDGGQPIIFAHGFGCSQEMWRDVAPAFAAENRVVLFDLVGAGGSDVDAYDPAKYDSLDGYADDLLEIIEALELTDVVYVGHSVSSMIGVLAAGRVPSRFSSLILVGPSPRYINEGDYFGGFEREDIAALLDALDANYFGWGANMSHVIMGNSDRPELADEWNESFCSIDPDVARHFARVTFLSDNRADLEKVVTPTLIVQSTDDAIAPQRVGEYVHDAIPGSTMVILPSTGHTPNLASPENVVKEIKAFLE
jgi:sigma-B regulation protein RsbQ